MMMKNLAWVVIVSFLTLLGVRPAFAEETKPTDFPKWEISAMPLGLDFYDISGAYWFSERHWLGLCYGVGANVDDHSSETFPQGFVAYGGAPTQFSVAPHSNLKRDFHIFFGRKVFEGFPLYVSGLAGILGGRRDIYSFTFDSFPRTLQDQLGLPNQPYLTYERVQLRRPYSGATAGLKFSPADVVLGLEYGIMYSDALRERITVFPDLRGLSPGAPQISVLDLVGAQERARIHYAREPRYGTIFRIFAGYRF